MAPDDIAVPANVLDGRTLIGKRLPRSGARRLLRGRGQYVGDLDLPRMLHLAFVRSPYAHAAIRGIDAAAALEMPGVERVVTARDIAGLCEPFVAVAAHRAGHKSAPQLPLAADKAVWQGQPVVAVLAASRAEAEDAAERIVIEWDELPALADAEAAVAPGAAAIHPEIGDNLGFQQTLKAGDPDAAFAGAAVTVERTFRFDRQTGLSLEPRGIIAHWDPGAETLTVHQSSQSPYQMLDTFSRHLNIPEHKVRVICPDIGGGFGLKINIYAEDLAICAISRMLGRPVKYLADRLESFVSDAHCRDHVTTARLAVAADGRITAMEMDDLAAVGAYGNYRRFNIAEGLMAITMMGAPYAFDHYRARTRSVYVNKAIVGMYRGVGMPIACVTAETLIDDAAAKLGLDPVEMRLANYRSRERGTMPCVAPSGAALDNCSFTACLEKLVAAMDYKRLRREQKEAAARGVWRGIGIATFAEQTAYGAPYYGPSGARITVQDGCSIRLETSGRFRVITSATDQGQGTWAGLAQIVASALGVGIDDVEMMSSDSAITPYGGGSWGSRGMAIAGEAALRAALTLRANILALAGAITQNDPAHLDIIDGTVVDGRSGLAVVSLAEAGQIGYFRQETLPPGFAVELSVTRSFVPNEAIYYAANGVQGSHVEIDTDTGFVRLLGHWAVDDCGRVINPLLVDEQVRGGIVQGIGAALFEQC
ncbi:MAG: xanthine dehydrogenase family protein molybdopterin-binding subunit, partial [Rhodospirillales bacterium]